MKFPSLNEIVTDETKDAMSNTQKVPEVPLFQVNLLKDQTSQLTIGDMRLPQVNFPGDLPVKRKRGRPRKEKAMKDPNDPSTKIIEIINNTNHGQEMESARLAKELQKARRAKKAELKALEAEQRTEANGGQASQSSPKNEDLSTPSVSYLAMIDNKLTLVDPNAGKENRPIIEATEEKPKKINAHSFRKGYVHSKKWSEEETKKFMRTVQRLGEDMSMVKLLFPGRTHNQIKNKYNREMKLGSFSKVKPKKNLSSLIHNFAKALPGPGQEDLMALVQANNMLPEPLEKKMSNTSNSSMDSVDIGIVEDIRKIVVTQIRGENEAMIKKIQAEKKSTSLNDDDDSDSISEIRKEDSTLQENMQTDEMDLVLKKEPIMIESVRIGKNLL